MADSRISSPEAILPQHSPSHWRLAHGFVVDAGDAIVVMVPNYTSLADATLIAAAPELLAELQRIVDYWARPGLRLTEWEAEELPKAMTLIAKTEGRSEQ